MTIIEYEDRRYPYLLKQIYDPPKRLFCWGDVNLLDFDHISIVGTRNITNYGRNIISNFLTVDLCKTNIAIVSGLARGVDEFTHSICLKRNIKTIAVIPTGVSSIRYTIAEKIVKNGGLVLSEFPSETVIQKYMFVLRNRIIAGLSMDCVVIQAGLHSGSLITAKYALENNRNVYVVPGSIYSPVSAGCNELAKQGAELLCGLDDFLNLTEPITNQYKIPLKI